MSVKPVDCIRDEIRALAAYHVPPARGLVKLDAMENPYALPETLRREIAALVAGADINRYPDPTAAELKARLRAAMGIPDACGILLGNGSDEIIQIVTQAVARPGASIVSLAPSFVMYRMIAIYDGMQYHGVPLNADFTLDLERMLAAIRQYRPALVFVSYPNNPTGNLFPEEAVAAIVRAAPGLVVVDEAYHVFAQKTFMTRLAEFPNLIVMRTVSKLGLAGLRLGYAAAAPELIAEFEKLRLPYNINSLTQLVAAKVLQHMDVLEAQAAAIRRERERLMAALKGRSGVEVFPSDANFVLVRVEDAPAAFEGMKRRGVLVKNLHGSDPLLAGCLRFTVGTPEENTLLLQAFEQSIAATCG